MFESVAPIMLNRLMLLSIEVALLGLLVWAIIKVFRIKSPRLRSLLWVLVMVKALAGLAIGTPFPVHKFSEPVMLAEGVDFEMLLLQQMAMERFLLSEGDNQFHAGTVAEVQSTQQQPSVSPASAPPSVAARKFSWGNLIFLFWIGGCCVMLLLFLRDQLKLLRLKRSSEQPSAPLLEQYKQIAGAMAIRRPPRLSLSKQLDSPALLGFLFSTILVPRQIVEDGGEKLNWALRHELMHYKCGDPWLLLLGRLSKVVCFFHPVIWWSSKRWEEEAELACDRALVSHESHAKNYAKELYNMLENLHNKKKYQTSGGLFATRTQIGRRIAALVTDPLSAPAKLGAFAVSALLVLTVMSVAIGGTFAERVAVDDEELQEKIAKTKDDLRNVALGLETYFIDHDGYPMDLDSLVKPIAYLHRVYMDPFDESRRIQWGLTKDGKKVGVWSVGPDGVDDGGVLEYDPSDGIKGKGDIFRVMCDPGDANTRGALRYYTIIPFFQSEKEKNKLKTASKDMEFLSHLVELYASKNSEFPVKLEDLLSMDGFLEKLPIDPYGNGETYKYSISFSYKTMETNNAQYLDRAEPEKITTEGETITVRLITPEGDACIMTYTGAEAKIKLYSVGPDGKDDGGKGLTSLTSATPKGDIVWYTIEKPTNVDNIPSAVEEGTIKDDFYTELLKMHKATGKDNAMLYYQQAALFSCPLPDNEVLDETLQNGWSEKNASDLLFLFDLYEPRFDLIRKGVGVNYAIMPDPQKMGAQTPIPNFLAAQVSSKLLCAQGLYFESQGEYDKALDNYLTVLHYGLDYGAENATLIGGLISVADEAYALHAIRDLAVSGNMSSELLNSAAMKLQQVEEANRSIVPFIDDELSIGIMELEKMLKGDEIEPEIERMLRKDSGFTDKQIQQLMENPDGYINPMREFMEMSLEFFAQPWWQRDNNEWSRKVEILSEQNTLAGMMMPNFVEADTRFKVTESTLRLVRTRIALEQCRQATGGYPKVLGRLVSEYLQDIPIDPFSGKFLEYSIAGSNYKLYSVGPDGSDQKAAIQYDPTNGTVSGGDIMR